MLYPKIETLYNRDPDTFKVIPGSLRQPEFGLVDKWLVTEKIDGTNIRVHIELGGVSAGMVAAGDIIDTKVTFHGRTDKAQMPPFLLKELQRLFPPDRFDGVFEDDVEEVTLFGEGYGAKIQKGGGDYREGVSFRLFDVVVYGDERDWWLTWDSVEDVAEKLGIQTVPVLETGAELKHSAGRVSGRSIVAFEEKTQHFEHLREQEGIVARTDPPLFDRRGHRLIWKLKAKDL